MPRIACGRDKQIWQSEGSEDTVWVKQPSEKGDKTVERAVVPPMIERILGDLPLQIDVFHSEGTQHGRDSNEGKRIRSIGNYVVDGVMYVQDGCLYIPPVRQL